LEAVGIEIPSLHTEGHAAGSTRRFLTGENFVSARIQESDDCHRGKEPIVLPLADFKIEDWSDGVRKIADIE
jgi:hypothetical protein